MAASMVSGLHRRSPSFNPARSFSVSVVLMKLIGFPHGEATDYHSAPESGSVFDLAGGARFVEMPAQHHGKADRLDPRICSVPRRRGHLLRGTCGGAAPGWRHRRGLGAGPI